MAYATNVRQGITLEGSTKIICEYLDFAMNNILYQRSVFPQRNFRITHNYGLRLFVAKDNADCMAFFKELLAWTKVWIQQKRLTKVTLYIVNQRTNATVETWEFTIRQTGGNEASANGRDVKKIRDEIHRVMRQITATISFLPHLNFPMEVTFNFEGITKADWPSHWGVSDWGKVSQPDTVQLKSFSTGFHDMATAVTYSTNLL